MNELNHNNLTTELFNKYDWLRLETSHGKVIACGGIFPATEIKQGQEWQGSSGHIVRVDKVNYSPNEVVYYSWNEDGRTKSHIKDHFSFQCRYCLIVE